MSCMTLFLTVAGSFDMVWARRETAKMMSGRVRPATHKISPSAVWHAEISSGLRSEESSTSKGRSRCSRHARGSRLGVPSRHIPNEILLAQQQIFTIPAQLKAKELERGFSGVLGDPLYRSALPARSDLFKYQRQDWIGTKS